MIAGVDFGARSAGSTAICFEAGDRLHLLRVPKQQDADAFVERFVEETRPQALYIDAPLSLPAAYFQRGDDFLYRHCDRALGAMSPMFLGGLTARAMRLRQRLATVPVYEVYPRATARMLQEHTVEGYRTSSPQEYLASLAKLLPFPPAGTVTSWHEVDAALAWWSGWRHQRGQAVPFGDPHEGIIWV